MPKNSKNDLKSAAFSTFSLLVLCCFFFSGLAGLIYQILWLRMIDKVIGSAPFAVATVLSVFMGGLALGSWLAGKYIDRIGSKGNLLSLYGLAEIAIGIYGLLLPVIILALKPVYVCAYNSMVLHAWFYRLFTFSGCTLILLIPTTLMGITLPVLCRFYVENLGHIGARTGRLYGINTIGAAVGAVLCGFLFIAKFGVWGTLGIAVGINFLVGFLCIVLAKNRGAMLTVPTVESKPPATADFNESPSVQNGEIVLALWIFGVSGFCAMAYEVFWTRLLGLTIGPTTYSFSLVVATFIVGLAIGNILFGRLADRVKGTFRLLVATQVCVACLALVVSQFLGNSQFFFSKLIYGFQGDFGGKIFAQSIILFFVLIGPTIFLGAAFPLVNKLYARSLPHIGRSIGVAYAVNTVGAILGSFVAGFILIPFLGKENGLRITACLQVAVCAVSIVYIIANTGKKPRAAVLGAVIVALSLLLLISFPSWNHKALSRGWYYRFDSIKQYFSNTSWGDAIWKGSSRIAGQMADYDVVFYGDGIGGFTTVLKRVNPIGSLNYYLINSGKIDASSHSDRLTQALSAHVPLLFHPDPKKVMVLGLASGMTAGEALLYPIERLDILEINDQVIKAAEIFAPYNNNCLANPKTRMLVQDGRNHLELTSETYDVIISEPSNPWMAGLANLFTLDYFRTAKKRLSENGIFVQWTNAYDMDWENFSMIGRTFAEVFPESLLIRTIGSSDFLLIGFSGKKDLSLETAAKNMRYAAQSENITLRDPKVLFELIVSENLETFFGQGPLHTDNWPRLEFAAPKTIGQTSRILADKIANDGLITEATRKKMSPDGDIDASMDYLELMTAGSDPPFRSIDMMNATGAQQKRFQDVLVAYCSDEYVTNYNVFPNSDCQKECAGVQIAEIQKHLVENPEDSLGYYRLALGLGVLGDSDGEIAAFRKAISLNPEFFSAYISLGEALLSKKQYDEAIIQLSEALRIDPSSAEAANNLGTVYMVQGDTSRAISFFTKAYKIDPDHTEAYNNLGCLYADQGNTSQAVFYFSKAIDTDPGYAAAHSNLGRTYADQGLLEDALLHFTKAVELAPGDADFHNDVGMTLGQLGRIAESGESFTEALKINPKHFLAHYNLGVALLNEGRLQAAADHFFEANTIYPDDPDVHGLLGMVLGNLGRIEEAADQFLKVLELNPDSAAAHDNLGVALYQMDRTEEAIEHFHKALDIDETFNLALEHLKVAVAAREG
jgi:spermidine synthase